LRKAAAAAANAARRRRRVLDDMAPTVAFCKAAEKQHPRNSSGLTVRVALRKARLCPLDAEHRVTVLKSEIRCESGAVPQL